MALRDGREVTGLLISQDPKTIVVRINGIDTPFPADSVEDIRVLPSPLDQYRELREAIDDKDAQQLLTLVKWLQQRRLYEEALLELAHILELEPANPEALSLRRLIESQILLDVKAGPTRPAGQEAPRPARAAEAVFPLLSADQVNLIKVFELDLTDPPRMIVSRDTVAQLVERYAGNPLIPPTREGREALAREKPEKILDLMFRVRARDLYGQVKVIDHPTPMRRFREDVHRGWLLNGCATASCHGGQESGRLWLYNRRASSDATVYTNFLILDRFRLPDGKALIDYNDPANSPLLQMGLPRADSLYPHPRVNPANRSRDWRHVFGSTDDRKFLDAVAWINSLYRPRPEYPISYQPPVPALARNMDKPAPPAPGSPGAPATPGGPPTPPPEPKPR
ncbi:MAG: hypothetical protein IT436_11770 [Phycisphaerales bacterium]|nr:hypothetical protein [Phycisphaerales bacterium]